MADGSQRRDRDHRDLRDRIERSYSLNRAQRGVVQITQTGVNKEVSLGKWWRIDETDFKELTVIV